MSSKRLNKLLAKCLWKGDILSSLLILGANCLNLYLYLWIPLITREENVLKFAYSLMIVGFTSFCYVQHCLQFVCCMYIWYIYVCVCVCVYIYIYIYIYVYAAIDWRSCLKFLCYLKDVCFYISVERTAPSLRVPESGTGDVQVVWRLYEKVKINLAN